MVNRKKNNKNIIKYIIYIILLIAVITIAILIPEREDSLKSPYHESTEIKLVIDDILGNSGVQRLEVIETSEEKVVNDHKIIFTNYNITLNDEEKYNSVNKLLIETLISKWTIFSKSEYELNSQKTTTYYAGFDNYITSFIAISFIKETREESRHPVVAIIIDDMGNDTGTRFKTLLKLEGLTFSVLPGLRHSEYTVQKGMETGHEIMLHCPMEPINPDLVPKNDHTMLLANMSKQEIKKTLLANLKSVPQAKGLNNHMGSKFTQDKERVTSVMNILKKNNMYYVDSLTIQNSVAWKTAEELGVPFLKRDVFLDHKNEKKYIKRQISKLIRASYKKGYAVAIGHIRGVTPETLEEAYEEFKVLGIEVVPVSYIIENKDKLVKNGHEVTEEVEGIINEYLDH